MKAEDMNGAVGGFFLLGFLVAWIAGSMQDIGFSQSVGDGIGPSNMWLIVLPAVVLSVANVVFLVQRSTVSMSDDHKFVRSSAVVFAVWFLGYLWLHDAHALLRPALIFTGLQLLILILRGILDGEPAPLRVPERTAARAQAGTPSSSSGLAFPPAKAPIEFEAQKPRYTFADVEGMEALKRELLAFGQEALVTEQQARKLRPDDPKSFRNGALLHGAPGNGKTFIAEALAGELGIPIIKMSIAEIMSKWVGQTTEKMVQAFNDAAAQAPCLLFWDEVDSIAGDRGAMDDPSSEVSRTVNAFLTKIVNTRGKGVVIMAATNFPDKLDSAGKREGRFDTKILIPAPDYEARLGILRRAVASDRVVEDSLERAARHFDGFSVVRLTAIGKTLRENLAQDKSDRPIGFWAVLGALRAVQGLYEQSRPDASGLDNIVLRPDAKASLLRLAGMMRKIEDTERAGAVIQPGAVFYGPPGTGKTLTAKALAKTTGWTFISTTGQDLVRRDDAMDKLIAKASDERPAIVFIDEADDILADRTYSPHTKMATNKLLTLLDGSGGRIPDVLFIAATNNPDLFDVASRRRFPIKIEFALPGTAEIEAFVNVWMAKLPSQTRPTFPVDQAVSLLQGKSIADIKVALQEAVNIAVSRPEPHRGVRRSDLAKAVRSLSFE